MTAERPTVQPASQPAVPPSGWLPDLETEQALEECLSRPSPEVVRDLAQVPGDLLLLGVGGKIGPSLARMARRALVAAEQPQRRVIGVARFSEPGLREALQRDGIETIASDLMQPGALEALPEAANVIYLAARKFGSTGNEPLTWAVNTYLPGRVAERYRRARIVCYSTGNVYPLTAVDSGGPTEEHPVGPVGEYAQSCLGRERMFQHFSALHGTPGAILRLNYAVELRYGVLLDIARKVRAGQPIDLTMGHVNVIWQGDANAVTLRALRLCTAPEAVPPVVLNLTGPETLSVRWLALRCAELLGTGAPRLTGQEAPTALLSNAARCSRLFGPPAVSVEQALRWVVRWVQLSGRELAKPTKFQVRDGNF